MGKKTAGDSDSLILSPLSEFCVNELNTRPAGQWRALVTLK